MKNLAAVVRLSITNVSSQQHLACFDFTNIVKNMCCPYQKYLSPIFTSLNVTFSGSVYGPFVKTTLLNTTNFARLFDQNLEDRLKSFGEIYPQWFPLVKQTYCLCLVV